MRVKARKQTRAVRITREMYARHESQCRRWERQAIAATKRRYRGYIVLALAKASGQDIHCWPYSMRPAPIGRGRWAFHASGLNGHCIDEWRGVRHWRRAKKLALRIATRPVTWSSTDVRACYAQVLPWRCV